MRILELVDNNKNITYKELAEILGITEKSIYKNIEKLKQKGILKRIGLLKVDIGKLLRASSRKSIL